MKKIAIIGAGISGTVCAFELHKENYDVTLFDKSRGVSGRSTSKRWDPITGIAIDMGVPYIFMNEIENNQIFEYLIDANIIVPWDLVQNKNNEIMTYKTYVGTPKMSTIARSLSKGINLITEAKINKINYTNNWTISSENDEWNSFDYLILAIPAAQYNLIDGISDNLYKEATKINYQAVNTLLLEMKSPLWFDEYNEDIINSPYIKKVIADYQKPGREEKRFTYAIHAQESWSTKTFDELSKEDVERIMVSEVLNKYNRKEELILKKICHRWKFSQLAGHLESIQQDFLKSSNNLYACGDWLNGFKFSSAFSSGYNLAQEIKNGEN